MTVPGLKTVYFLGWKIPVSGSDEVLMVLFCSLVASAFRWQALHRPRSASLTMGQGGGFGVTVANSKPRAVLPLLVFGEFRQLAAQQGMRTANDPCKQAMQLVASSSLVSPKRDRFIPNTRTRKVVHSLAISIWREGVHHRFCCHHLSMDSDPT